MISSLTASFHSGAFPREPITNICPSNPPFSDFNTPSTSAYKISAFAYPPSATPPLPHFRVVASFIVNTCPALPALSAVNVVFLSSPPSATAYKMSPALYPSLVTPAAPHFGADVRSLIVNTCPASPLLSAIIPLSPAYKRSPAVYPSLATYATGAFHSGVVSSFITNACPAVPIGKSFNTPSAPAYRKTPLPCPSLATPAGAFHFGVVASSIVNT